MNNLIEFVLDKIKTNFTWLIVTILVAIISCITCNLRTDNRVLFYEFLFAALIITSALLVCSYSSTIYKDYRRIMLSEQVPKDVKMTKYHHKILFDNTSLETKDALMECNRKLQNNMIEHTYNLYRVKIISSKDVPDLKNIKIIMDKKNFDLSRETVNAMKIVTFEANDDTYKKPLKKEKTFTLPLHIHPGKSCEFSVSYRSKAFSDAFSGKKDYKQIAIDRVTDELIFDISLTENMRKQYYISKCDENDDSGSSYDFQIFDGSQERMKLAEKELRILEMVPGYNDNNKNLTWAINNPKIGYKYRLYFTLKQITTDN